MKISAPKTLLRGGVAILALLASAAAQAQTRNFDVPAEDAVNSIPEFARQAGIQIVAPADRLVGVKTPAVKGSLELHAALTQLLAGTDMSVASDTGQTIMLKVTPKNVQAASNEADRSSTEVETVVVTGSNIRGVVNQSSPVGSYTRDQIDKSGVGTVAEFVRQLPENFSGGASDETFGTLAGGGTAANSTGGSGVNLRGLGSDSTLVLLDGHRLAAGNTNGNFVDITMIPVSALERVDVLPDGASAIYGSDAVGGVVNFVLRHDFDGAETRARAGFTSDGGGTEEIVGQTLGKVWDTGSALLSYQYNNRASITAADRSFTASITNPPSVASLVPSDVTNSLFGTFRQALGGGVDLFAEALWSHRSTKQDFDLIGQYKEYFSLAGTNYGGTGGLDLDLGSKRQLELSSTYNGTESDDGYVTSKGGQAFYHTTTTLTTVDGKIDGPLMTVGDLAISFAAGGQYRHETFAYYRTSLYKSNRNIFAGFAEINVPIVGPSDGSDRNILELNLADRFEHYSDAGNTNNPKIGVSWRPLSDVKVRGSWGSSFRAPLLNDLNPVSSEVVAESEPDPLTTGNSNVLILFGGNPNLKPQTSSNWTTGLDWNPSQIPGMKVTMTCSPKVPSI